MAGMAHLIFYRRGQELMRVALGTERLLVGRGTEADVVVPDPSLRRTELAIEWDGQRHRVRTLGAEGPAPETQVLEDGGALALGQFRAAYLETLPEDAAEASRALNTSALGAEAQELPREVTLHSRLAGSNEAPTSRPLGHSAEIGSGQGVALKLEHATVSARHAKVHRHDGRLMLQDLGSTNGTFLSGLRVYEVELPLGVHARVGPFEIWADSPRLAAAIRRSEYEGMVSEDPSMHALFAQIDRVAASDAPVAIAGETGTGKELVARAIHRRSKRAANALIPINCAAIARELVESELFGHEKGAFTGAAVSREGALSEAHRGTLFLDEIGELPLELQPKLLRALELGEVKKVGATRPEIVDVRFVCATHRSLADEVRRNRFREDLYFRVAVLTLYVPPLRQRRSDVPLLWDHFMARLSPPGARPTMSDAAEEKLRTHSWPGNVRELRNVVQRALLSASGGTLGPDDIHFDPGLPVASASDSVVDPKGLTLEQIEREALAIVMRQLSGNRRAAARQLSIAKSTLLKKLSDYQLEDVGRSVETADDD
jgi:two-component system, NtrC family, response regulator HydG